MISKRRGIPWALTVAGVLSLAGSRADAQGPTIDTPDVGSPGGGNSPFGRTPGAGGQGAPVGNDSLLGGRAGPTAPKGVPTSISNPNSGLGTSLFSRQGVAPTPDQAPATVPAAGALGFPPTEEDPGPADGLTLDEAISRLIRDNLDLKSKFYEIPQAKADILTANLRANPVFYADAQLVPYGQYTRTRPGGQTQYDVNISIPFDVSRKRHARTRSAVLATKVVEAQYQDAVRQSVDNVYSGYVDLLQARRTIAFSQAGLNGLNDALKATEDLLKGDEKKKSDVAKVRIQRAQAEQQLLESREAYRKAKIALALQLNIVPDQAEMIEPRGTLMNPVVTLPSTGELIQLALQNRPDIMSYRLGVKRAESDVKLQYANRYQDIYILAQPYTLQDNTPFGLKSPTSWALGVTVPLPIFNRNQGNIQRSKLNVTQTQVELGSVERQAINDVQVAEREYLTARASVERFESTILPDSKFVLDEVKRLYTGGEATVLEYLSSLKDYNDNARSYLDSLVRLRRAVLTINTAVGQRILP